jgi:hypothetical protein
MRIDLIKLQRIIVFAMAALCVLFVSVCDCLMNDQIIDSFDHCEWENYFFDLIPLDGNIPDSIISLPLEPPFPLIAVTASQVFHPPAIV